MPRLSNRVPSYRLHKSSGQAVVTLTGKSFYLGTFGTPASRAEYDRLVAEWVAGRRIAPPIERGPELTISELIEAFWIFANEKYRQRTGRKLPDGTYERVPTPEISNLKSPLRILRRLYGHTQAATFNGKSLATIRSEMIRIGWCRTNINRQIDRIRRVFSWACGEPGLIRPEQVLALSKVGRLSESNSPAPESEPVRPVDPDHARAIKPFVSDEVAALIELQLLTGMRPGEACTMRGCDLSTDGDVWTYTPAQHKTKHKGKSRTVFLGPRAQDVIRPFLRPDLSAYLFQPREAMRRRREARHAARVTPPGVGNEPGDNRTRRPKRAPGERYTTASYGRAIRRGCQLAFPAPALAELNRLIDDITESDKLPRSKAEKIARQRRPDLVKSIRAHDRAQSFHAHQIRHTVATEVRRAHGLEAAQVMLGHSTLQATQVYAEKNEAVGRRIAADVG